MPISPGQNYHMHIPDEECFLNILNWVYPGQFKTGLRYDSFDFKTDSKTTQDIYIEFKRVHRLSTSVDYYMLPLAKYIALEDLIESGHTVYYILKFDDIVKVIRLVTGMLEGYQIDRYQNRRSILLPSHLFTDSIIDIIRDSGLIVGDEFIEVVENLHKYRNT